MQVEGQYTINAPIERVWAYLQDPAGLQACIPGCEKLEPRGEDSYEATLKVGVAAVKGTYQGKVEHRRQGAAPPLPDVGRRQRWPRLCARRGRDRVDRHRPKHYLRACQGRRPGRRNRGGRRPTHARRCRQDADEADVRLRQDASRSRRLSAVAAYRVPGGRIGRRMSEPLRHGACCDEVGIRRTLRNLPAAGRLCAAGGGGEIG